MTGFSLSASDISTFRSVVLGFYERQGRMLPWRNTNDPYEILVSEFMLQQTQVPRVLKMYPSFLTRFSTIVDLARALQSEVLAAWQGLGYNRRALYLHRTACQIVENHRGIIPDEISILKGFPGIGQATASAICTFAYGRPTVFLETNIRTVFIHHFFSEKKTVSDGEIFPLIKETLDKNDPRMWYYALMDYGVAIKAAFGNPGRRSASYVKQSPFRGSDRQLRSSILREILKEKRISHHQLAVRFGEEGERMERIVTSLVEEGFMGRDERGIFLKA